MDTAFQIDAFQNNAFQIVAVVNWVIIDDAQTANWQLVDDSQSGAWIAINDAQTPNWTQIVA